MSAQQIIEILKSEIDSNHIEGDDVIIAHAVAERIIELLEAS
jgi:hypothetical protein